MPMEEWDQALIDDYARMEQARVDEAARKDELRAIITDLQVEKERFRTVANKDNSEITNGDVKDVARAGIRTADAAIELARAVLGNAATPVALPKGADHEADGTDSAAGSRQDGDHV